MDFTREQLEREEKLKAMAAEQEVQGQCGNLNKGWEQLSLIERIRIHLGSARKEARRAEELSELEYLLEKHPDVARILELLDRAQPAGRGVGL